MHRSGRRWTLDAGRWLQDGVLRFSILDSRSSIFYLLLATLFFYPITLGGLILGRGDALFYFIPYRDFADAAICSGHLPLWNPYLFLGVPFLANSQAGVLYPVHWLLCSLPAPQAIAASLVLHAALAGWLTYLYARKRAGLATAGALLAGILFSLSTFLVGQAEHPNQFEAAAWLPLAVFALTTSPRSNDFSRSLPALVPSFSTERRTSFLQLLTVPSILLSVVLALVLLTGHTQTAFIVLVGLGLVGLEQAWAVVKDGRRKTEDGRRTQDGEPRAAKVAPVKLGGVNIEAMFTPLARLLTSAVLAAMLTAPQLLPTLELSRLSTRQGGLPYREAVSFSLRPRLLVYTLFPAVGNDPAQVFASPAYSEFLATVGVIGLGLALLGIWQGQRNGRRRHLILVVAGFALALGVFNPLYYVLYRLVPGFSLFRAPARWMLLTMFGLALLSGTGLDALGRRAAQMRLPWRWLLGVLALWAFLAVLPDRNTLPAPLTVLEWLAAVGVLALAWRLRPLPRWAQAGVLVLAVTELWLAASGLAYRAATLPEVASALRTAPSHLLADPQRVLGQFRFISLSGTGWDPGDLGTIRANLGKRVSERALYDYVIGVKQQEILAPNLPLLWRIPAVDGYDGGLLPTARYVALERLLLDNHQEPPPDGRLREILTHIPAGRWLNLLNVKYVITDKLFDLWYEGVYYDLQHRASLSPGQPVTASEVPPLEATAVGVISYLEDAPVADGIPVAEIRLTAADGRQQRIALRAGIDTAAGQLSANTSTLARAVHAWPQGGGQDYLGMLALDAPMQPVTITVTSLLNDGRVVVRGISLIDTRTQTHVPVMLSTEGRFARVHSGDVKVYQNLDVLPHVYLVGRARSVATDEAALQMLADPAFDPHREVLLQDTPLSGSAPTESLQGTAQVVGYSPEKIDINVQTEQAAWLVLGESDYPGWQASIDGRTVPIRRANYLFQAIEVPAGTHQVTFTFGSKGLQAGLLVMALAAVLCAVLLGIRFSPYTNGRVYTPSCASCWC